MKEPSKKFESSPGSHLNPTAPVQWPL